MIHEPDWKDFYTPAEAEKQLEGFQFKGIGWYETGTDTILVLDPIETGKHKGRYVFWCWNHSGARQQWAESVSKITHMPVRVKHK